MSEYFNEWDCNLAVLSEPELAHLMKSIDLDVTKLCKESLER